MWTATKTCLAMPLALVAGLMLGAGSIEAKGAGIIDGANLFSGGAIQKAQTELDQLQAATRVPFTIETVESLNGRTVNDVLRQHAEAARAQGVYILIAKQEGKFDIEASKAYRGAMDASKLAAIKNSFVNGLKQRDFDGALLGGTNTIRAETSGVAVQPAGAVRGRRANPQGGFGMGSLLGIGLLIIGVMFLFRLLGGLFGGGMNRGYGMQNRMGAPGYGGMGAPGGGGFMSSLLGGIGGAMAGNWLYDQFSGRGHQSYNEGGMYDQPDNSAATDWSGGTDQSADWGGGGNDAGAGGDWGGGGGDWGGGGGGGDW